MPESDSPRENMQAFVEYRALLYGDEKGEAQVFCDRLFRAFGHAGYKEAGASLEYRIKKNSTKGTSFADLVWKPRVLIEMKKRGEKLALHYKQAFEYWLHAVPDRPRYVVLCNFDEFWIFDFDRQLDDPVDVLVIEDLPKRYTALNFLFPEDRPPIFGNDREAVSREAADKVVALFSMLVARGIPRGRAQRFVLQLVVAMFSEDIGLLPASCVYSLVEDCLKHGQSSYDVIGSLFSQMNNRVPASGGRFKHVPYFNGGLFAINEPIELTTEELKLLGGPDGACAADWSKINPAIFGTLFEHSMDATERHAFGAHYTTEADIMRIVGPTIVKPWRERIGSASTLKALAEARKELLDFKVLDPACGSGNFLYIAYRELARLEMLILERMRSEYSYDAVRKHVTSLSFVPPTNFYGIDVNNFAVELAKVTLLIAKKLALDEAHGLLESLTMDLGLEGEQALPLDNLDKHIIVADALFIDWPKVDAIVSNPPFQSKNKIQAQLGRAYVNRVRATFPDVDARADYCVYWFRRTHDHLKKNQRAGLVGTNTIRQNYSRKGGLDHIVANGGTITEAVSSMAWSGEAAVDVSVVNWVKGDSLGSKVLLIQAGSDPSTGWKKKSLPTIGPALTFDTDVSQAVALAANSAKGGCFQGQTHGHEAFLLSATEAHAILLADPKAKDVLFPYLIANELIGSKDAKPARYVIDFGDRSLLAAKNHSSLFARIQSGVLPARKKAAKEEEHRNKEALADNANAKINRHHKMFLNRWWQLSYPRKDMLDAIGAIPRYIVCGQVTLRPIFEFISNTTRPNAALVVFPFADDYSFGILQSNVHWEWFKARCSTLAGRFRYTSNTVFDSFPWPQSPTESAVRKVAIASKQLRDLRYTLRKKHGLSYRELYRSIELPGAHPLKNAHVKLDKAVHAAYGMTATTDTLAFLLNLNQDLAALEAAGKPMQGPGVPASITPKVVTALVTADCLSV